jgi:fatty acid desaturase
MTDTDQPADAGGVQQRFASSYSALLGEVEAACLMGRRRGHYFWRIGALTALLAGIWTAFAWLGDSWFQLILAGLLAVAMSQIGFVAHEATHRQIFASRGWNEWTARILGAVGVGLSYNWWNNKHSRHHSGPNQVGKDPDIAPGVISFTTEAAQAKQGRARKWVEHQGWYFMPLLLLEGLHLHISSVLTLVHEQNAKHRWVELGLIALRLGGYVAVLLIFLPLGKASAFLGVQLGAFGLLLGGAFAPNHIGMPIVARGINLDFLRRQVLMSRNIRGGRAMDIAMGGLNRQIEHHLFPSMARPNLRRATPIVRRYCEANGVLYTETTMFQAYRTIIGYLNRVGLSARRTVQCPLASQLR